MPGWIQRSLIIAGSLAVATLLVGAGLKLYSLRGSPDVMTKMVPSNTDVYATVYLDPSLKQKMNLRGLLGKFPQLRSNGGIDAQLDRLMNSFLEQSRTGWSFRSDVRPWLGSQVGLIVRVVDGEPHVALLIAAKDDRSALVALGKLRSGPDGRNRTWTVETRGSVPISIGRLRGKSHRKDVDVYAFAGHTAVLGSDVSIVDAVADTVQGTSPSISSLEKYQAAVRPLPSGRLALVYVNAQFLFAEFRTSGGPDLSTVPSSFSQLFAYQGIGMAISAQPNGMAVDVNVGIDSSRLSEAQRRALGAPAHVNALLTSIPRNVYGFYSFTGLRETVEGSLDQLAQQPGFQQVDQELHLTGPGGLASHLTSDSALEVEAGTGSHPAGAWLFGTDDPKAMYAFLDKVSSRLAAGMRRDRSLGRGRASIAVHREKYRGVRISSIAVPAWKHTGVAPSYAVADGVVIVASSPDEVKRVIEARATGVNVASGTSFRQASAATGTDSPAMAYADIAAIASAVRDALPPADRGRFDRHVAPDLDPFKAILLTQHSAPDRSSIRVFILIG